MPTSPDVPVCGREAVVAGGEEDRWLFGRRVWCHPVAGGRAWWSARVGGLVVGVGDALQCPGDHNSLVVADVGVEVFVDLGEVGGRGRTERRLAGRCDPGDRGSAVVGVGRAGDEAACFEFLDEPADAGAGQNGAFTKVLHPQPVGRFPQLEKYVVPRQRDGPGGVEASFDRSHGAVVGEQQCPPGSELIWSMR